VKRQKAIEPSEILIGDDGTVRDMLAAPSPWLRFLARMFDYALFFSGLGVLFRSKVESSLVPFEYFLWIPIEAAFYHWLGTTPGKWLLGIDLRQGRVSKLDYLTALRRSFSVWFRGLGMGIPFVNIVCMLVAFQRLKVFHLTTWDRDDHLKISYRRIGKWRIILAILVTVLGFGFYYAVSHGMYKEPFSVLIFPTEKSTRKGVLPLTSSMRQVC
jgi:hypothetical protein